MIYKTFFSLVVILSLLLSSTGNARSIEAEKNLQTLLKTRSCVRCDLKGLDLNRYDLSATDLREADLSQCNFTLANLSNANLSGAKLQGAILHGTDLGNANLSGADFRNAQGASAYIAGVNAKGIIATGEFATLFAKQSATVNAPTSYNEELKESTAATYSKTAPPSSVLFPSYHQQSVSAEIPPEKDGIERLRAKKRKKLATQQILRDSTKAKVQPIAPSSVKGIRQIYAAPKKKLKRQMEAGVANTGRTGIESAKHIQQDKKKHLVTTTSSDGDKTSSGDRLASLRPLKQSHTLNNTATVTPKATSTSATGNYATSRQNYSQKQNTASSFIPPQAGEPTALQQENLAKLHNGKRCYKCNFSKLDFARANLNRADLEGSNFYGCNLQYVDFSGANLKGVNFQGADLRGANLKNADLYKAHLGGANLRGVNLQGALLDGSYTEGVIGLGQ